MPVLRAGVLLASLFAAGQAAAETRLVPAIQLSLSASSSANVEIAADPSLHGQVRLSMENGLSCVAISGGDALAVSTARCSDESGPLHIDIPPDAPLTLAASGDGNLRLGDVRGPLNITLAGSGNLVAGSIGPVAISVSASGDATLGDVRGPAVISLTGSGDVRVKALHGPLTLKQVGSGDLAAGSIESDGVVLDGSGSGDVLLGAGHIENLQARMVGSGDLSVAASIGNATVDMRGGGDAKLGPIAGTLNRSTSGDSSITVLDSAQAQSIARSAERKLGRGRGNVHVIFGQSGRTANALTVAFVALMLFLCWRIIRRGGGLAGLRRGWRGGAVAAPSNPAVLALGETMSRLDARLGRLESYVTTREFDLARKFRELGPH